MTIKGKTVLITGANRGLGQALVDEALRRGAERVYAASRQPFAHPDHRVTPLIMDVTDWAQIQRAVESVESLDILINNAGLSLPDDLNSRAAFEQHFDVNVYGPLMVTQALLPSLTQSRGRIVNVVSIGAFAAVPLVSTLIMAGRDQKKAEEIRAKTNVNGGAIAMGHPTGATAARMIMTLMYELRRRRQTSGDSRPYYGLATLCGGIGEGEAVIVKVGG